MSQKTFFDSDWGKEWVDMPEFVQEAEEFYSLIKIRFKTKEDLEEFSKLIGQKLTKKTKSIRYPQLIKDSFINKRYCLESE